MITGISLNGVFFFTPTYNFGVDALFPADFGAVTGASGASLDQCLGSVSGQNTYGYYMYSPCLYEVALRTQSQKCKEGYELCNKSPTWHAAAYTPLDKKVRLPVGIAKDGHPIYGPYKENGEFYGPCDVDVCNGVTFKYGTLATEAYYGYVSTMFFPYTVGCWGPGNKGSKIQVRCSTNARYCSESVIMSGFLPLVIASAILSFIFA